MNNTLTNPIKQIKEKSNIVSRISNTINSLGFISEKDREFSFSDHICYLVKASESADQKVKNKIENHMVKMGEKAVPYLVNSLIEAKGKTRGLVAMTLIRIGSPSISCLEEIDSNNPELSWVADYIINEIKGLQLQLNTPSIEENRFEKVLVS